MNITKSRISFNTGDGVNITVTGGNRNVSRSTISSNRGYGFAVWLNESSSQQYLHFNQTTAVEYSAIFQNSDVGILVRNFFEQRFLTYQFLQFVFLSNFYILLQLWILFIVEKNIEH